MALVFEQLLTEELGDASYLVGDGGIAAIVDPMADVERYLARARAHSLAITHVVQTHLHEDHLSGAVELARRAGGADLCVSGHDAPPYVHEHRRVRDGERLVFGESVLTVRHTPGHTPEHLSLLLAQAASPGEPYAVMSGGSLLVGTAGRTDLLGEAQAETLARAQFRTLRDVFGTLADHVIVYPTHVHGSPCGAAIGERTSTAIGHERRHNPLFRIDDEETFVREALGQLPPKPTYYARLKEANLRGGAKPIPPAIRPLRPDAFERAMGDDSAPVLDTRHMLAFGAGHIPGALNIGATPHLSIWAGWMLDAEQPLLLVLERDSDLDDVLRSLRWAGFERFGGYLAGGITAWQNAGKPLRALRQLTVRDVAARRQDCELLDVRSPQEWNKGHVPDARHIFLPSLPSHLKLLDRQRPLAVYCDSGYRASIGASLLQRHGFDQVFNVPGSWQAWRAAGLPVQQ